MEREAKIWGERETILCPICGKEFSAPKKRHRVYCSRACCAKGRHKREIRKCLICGKTFEVYPCQVKKYCSVKCGGIGRRSGIYWTKKKRSIQRKYINGQIVVVHRYLMEKKIGRKLKSTEIVHHVDIDDQNNAVNNLYLCSGITEHMKVHKSIEKLVKELLRDNIITFMGGKYVYTDSRNMGRKINNL